MIITVECIHRTKDLPESIVDDAIWSTNEMVSDCNKITCRINSVSSDARFCFP